MVIDIQVFSETESSAIAQKLEAIRSLWIARGLGFYTVGVATYLDVMCSDNAEASYYGRLPATNALLRAHFADELDTVSARLAEYFKVPTRWEETVALPGFHVFENPSLTTTERPSQHFDLQHRFLRWPFGAVTDDVISFTLSVKLPRMGGALDVWNFDESDFKRLEKMGRRTDVEHVGRLKPLQRHRYRVGYMAVQLRPILHRISAIPETFEGDQRITLQGHGLRHNGEMVLYW
jgi:hypothetical protein